MKYTITLAAWLIAHVTAQTPAQIPALTLADALEATLRHHPQIRIAQQQVLLRQGVVREASGIFDRSYVSGLQQSYSPTPVSTAGGGASTASVNLTTFGASSTRLYRNGISAGPVFELARSRDRLSNPQGINQSRLAYQISVPLLRNRGTAVVSAGLISAGVEVEAARLDLTQDISDLLAATAASYWQLRGALRLLAVAASSEQRGSAFVENVRALIAADRVPRTEINQVQANLAERVAARIAAQQEVVAARQALALAMGVPPAQILAMGDPSEDLPAVAGSLLPNEAALRQYSEIALTRRADYLAAQKRIAAVRALLPAFKNQTRPNIELRLSSGYSGLREGVYPNSYLGAVGSGVKGADVVGGIHYQFAPANNAALGRLAQTEAAYRQAELRLADLARFITSGVIVSASGLTNSAARLEKANESVAGFQAALDAEREKYRLGIGFLVDLLTTEDRLTAALEVQVRAQLAYAVELAQLRRAVGAIIDPNPDTIPSVGPEVFRVPPDFIAGRP